MARHCHTQMPTSYLAHLCQDKTHEAGIGIEQLGEQKKKIQGEDGKARYTQRLDDEEENV